MSGAEELQEVELTPSGTLYSRELSIVRGVDGEAVASWVERAGREERVAWRLVRHRLGEIHRIPAILGAPSTPRVCGGFLFWLEFRDGEGHLIFTALPNASPQPVPALRGINCGEFDCAENCSGKIWLIVESWETDRVRPRIMSFNGKRWREHHLDPEGRFCVRPRLCLGEGRVIASWDEYTGDVYRITTFEPEEEMVRQLPCPEGFSEVFSELAFSGDGKLYASRCRERLVELDGGIATFHSELVVSELGSEGWEDIFSVDIDHAMNPWLSAYAGLRRRPSLIGSEEGVWLLWEEKEEPEARLEMVGRLCAVQPGGEPEALIRGRAMFVVERNGLPEQLLVASKTQLQYALQHLPYILHRVSLAGGAESRPEGLVSWADRPPFQISIPRKERAESEDGFQLYFGDPHLHSHFSQDPEGEQDELYHFAREVARLDFVCFAENDFHWLVEPIPESWWERNKRNAEFFNEPGVFTALLAWEYTKQPDPARGDDVHSHRTVIFAGNEGEIYSWFEGRVPSPSHLVRLLKGKKALLHHHHCTGFDITDDSLERNIEVCGGWKNCMLDKNFIENLHKLLNSGLRLGLIGASDNHERNPGLGGALTGVWAQGNTRSGIFDALFERRCFATTGLRPIVKFWLSGAFMGGEALTSDPPLIQLDVTCDRRTQEVEVIRDGELVMEFRPGEEEFSVEWADEDCSPGSHYYYAHILFEGEEIDAYWNIATAYGVHAWTSPVWVLKTP